MAPENNSFFPQGLALGENFCNRLDERKRLLENIHSARPTLITSPRRYGKTSLVLFVLQSLKLPFAYIDLYAELNEREVQNTILNAAGNALYAIESTPKKAFKLVSDFFAELSVGFKLMNAQVNIEFAQSKKSPAKTILDVLKKLDEALKLKNKKMVLFFDEFQRLSQITESAAIEGALRHIAQESKQLVFIFSGSNRALLSAMFDDKAKPLYKLCDRIILDRITENDYVTFIQNKFKKKWDKALPETVTESILSMTERHPYYVNLLCHRLWYLNNMPTEKEVEDIWRRYAQEEKTNVMNEIGLLSTNQAKMLIAIAKYADELTPLSKEFIALTRFSLSSAAQAIKSLEKRDYLMLNNKNKYTLVDPLIKFIFSA